MRKFPNMINLSSGVKWGNHDIYLNGDFIPDGGPSEPHVSAAVVAEYGLPLGLGSGTYDTRINKWIGIIAKKFVLRIYMFIAMRYASLGRIPHGNNSTSTSVGTE